MQCPNCSTENSDDSKFCMACGHALQQTAPVEAAAPPPPVEVAVPPAPVEAAAPPAPVEAAVPPPPVQPDVQEAGPAANPWLADTAGPDGAGAVDPEPATPPIPPVTEPADVVVQDAPAAGSADPHGFEAHVARMSEATRPYAEVPVLLAAMVLSDSETVIVVVPGLIDEVVGVAVVTDRRVLLVSGRRWKPVVVEFAIAPGLTVEGWQDAQSAMLTFHAGHTARIAGIVDKPLAFEAAGVVRDRVAAM